MRLGATNVSSGRHGIPSAAAPGVLRQSGTQTSPAKANQGGFASLLFTKTLHFRQSFPPLFSPFPVQVLWWRIAALRLCDFAFEASKDPRQVIHPLPQTRSAPSRGVSAQSGVRRVTPCQSQSNDKMLLHASKWQKMTRPPGPDPANPLSAVPSAVLSTEAPVAGAKVEAPAAGAKAWVLLSTKASVAADGEGANRAQSWIIVHNRGVFLFKAPFIRHLACSSRHPAPPAIESDGRRGCFCQEIEFRLDGFSSHQQT